MILRDVLQYNILYSCAGETKRGHVPFVHEHTLAYIMSGSISMHTEEGLVESPAGTVGLVRRNQLIRAIKNPGTDGPFMAINVILDQRSLRQYASENNVKATGIYLGSSLAELAPDPFIKGYFDSLIPYFENPGNLTEILARTKTVEAISLLLKHPSLRNLLLDFNEPFKIDLEAYMNKNFMHNVPLSRFAHLTGRSLSTFKRDFSKIANIPPEKWLLKRRLQEAHYLITQLNHRPSDIYMDIGFENFSHFSTAFKKEFGKTISELVPKSSLS
jgi:AraC-like DNA-binding protein